MPQVGINIRDRLSRLLISQRLPTRTALREIIHDSASTMTIKMYAQIELQKITRLQFLKIDMHGRAIYEIDV
jgi:hypothetical protein